VYLGLARSGSVACACDAVHRLVVYPELACAGGRATAAGLDTPLPARMRRARVTASTARNARSA